MPLQDLPLTHRKFSWETSNGEATKEQTQAGYAALTRSGLCRDFSYHIWNDLAASLGNLQAALGEERDPQAAMTASDKTLTAARFNALSQGLDALWPLPWPWEEALGRRQMYRGDRVYGRDILALPQRLNRLIGALQGEGIAALSHKGLLTALARGLAETARGIPLYGAEESVHGGVHRLLPGAGQPMGAWEANETAALAAALWGAAQMGVHRLEKQTLGRSVALNANAPALREVSSLEARGKERLLAAAGCGAGHGAAVLTEANQALAGPAADFAAGTGTSRSAAGGGMFPLPADGILFVKAVGSSRSRGSGVQAEARPQLLGVRGAVRFRTHAAIHNALCAPGTGETRSRSRICAALTPESAQGPWYPPIQTGPELYIRSVHTQTHQAETLRLR